MNRDVFKGLFGPRSGGRFRALSRGGHGFGLVPALAAGLALWAPDTVAQVTEANSTTVLRLMPDYQNGDKAASFWATEYVTLSVRDIDVPGVQDLKFQASGWGQAATNAEGGLGDIDVLYVQGSVLDRHLTFTLGRQLIVGGAARVFPLDGLNATIVSSGGFGLTAYVGAPTPSPLVFPANPLGDFAFGGRAFWRPSFGTEVGISFIEVLGQGVVTRQDLAVDTRVVILPSLSATASASFSLAAQRLVDAEVTVSWHVSTLELTARAQQSAPELYLPLNDIFTVFADTSRTGVGGGFTWQTLPRLSFFGNYEFLWVDGGTGNDAELGVAYKIGRRSTVGFNCHLLYQPVNGYADLRAWALQSLTEHIRLSADLDWVLLQHSLGYPDDLQPRSILGTLSATWAIGSGWSVMLSGTAGTSPYNGTQFTATGRVSYELSFVSTTSAKAAQ